MRGHPDHRDLLHHHILPLVHAADRAVAAGETARGRQHLHDVALLARMALHPHGSDDTPVLRAVGSARRVWGEALEVTVTDQDRLPDDLPHATTTVLHDLVLAGLHDVASHRPGARAQVALRTLDTEVVASVTGRGPASDPARVTDPAAYGLRRLDQLVRAQGGELQVHLSDDASILVARLPRHVPWWRRWRGGRGRSLPPATATTPVRGTDRRHDIADRR